MPRTIEFVSYGQPWRCAACRQIQAAETPMGRYAAYDGDPYPRPICPDCAGQGTPCERSDGCSYDGTHFPTSARWTVVETSYGDTEPWCFGCVDRYAEWCDCGEYNGPITSGWHSCYYEEDDYYDDEYPSDVRIEPYSYKPTPIFIKAEGQGKGRMYLGTELEIEVPHNEEGFILDLLERHVDIRSGRFYIKSDSSINYGFEIVSHPHTLEAWHEVQPALSAALQDVSKAGAYGVQAGVHIGQHVHISNTAFDSDRHLLMFSHLFYRNPDEVEALAGRDTDEWGQVKVGKGYAGRALRAKRRQLGTDRYVAVNLAPDKTTEIRVFRSSLNPTRVMGNIELVHAACEYSRGLTSAHFRTGGWTWNRFMAWAMDDDRYANLRTLVDDEGYPLDYAYNEV